MTVRRAGFGDLGWVIATLAARRERLVPHAPVFWRPAPDAPHAHRKFLESQLVKGGAQIQRTDTAVLVATPRTGSWVIDDAHVPDATWVDGDGPDLWNAFAADCSAAELVRFVCPVYEEDRATFARMVGLVLEESWWLLELEDSGGGEAGQRIPLPGAEAITVAAPPVYAPPGPILFLPALSDIEEALPAARSVATQHGCAAVVVNQLAGEDRLADGLTNAGFRRHCDYYGGPVRAV